MEYKGLIRLVNRPCIKSTGSAVGKKEMEGPLAEFFDVSSDDDKFGQKTWEQSESEMARIAFETALLKGKCSKGDIDLLFAGDLLNQCTAQSFGLLDENVPYIGIYGACSNLAEGLMLSAMCVNAGYAKLAAVSTSSHFCSAERQFRFPIEYGSQRTPTAQHTVTGAASIIVESSLHHENDYVYINEVLPGRIVDMGITDSNNMGAAMANAALDTLKRYFMQTNLKPDDFDLILTGDLGAEGMAIVKDLAIQKKMVFGENLSDCGLMVYDLKKQDMHAGGSGCGCSGVVVASHLMEQFRQKKCKDILFLGTGALMSPGSVMQKLSIPGIAHLVRLTHS